MTLRYTIYVDMDGVLFDFESKYLEICQKKIDPSFKSMKEVNDADKDRTTFKRLCAEEKVFEQLQPLSGAYDLLKSLFVIRDFIHPEEAVFRIEILSSVGRSEDPEHLDIVSKQKMNSLKNHFSEFDFDGYNFVDSKKAKARFAGPFTMLIDDSEGCCRPFQRAGGEAVLYTEKDFPPALLCMTIGTSLATYYHSSK